MRDSKYSYEELNEYLNKNMFPVFMEAKQFDDYVNSGEIDKARQLEPKDPEQAKLKGDTLVDLALKMYVMGEDLDLVYFTTCFANRYYLFGWKYFEEVYSKGNKTTLSDADYSRFLQMLSISFLLDFTPQNMMDFNNLLSLLPADDILLSTIMYAMLATPTKQIKSDNNYYNKLVEVISEPDVVKAEDMLIDFLENDWYENSANYPFRENEDSPDKYLGMFSYESAAIVIIRNMDLNRFRNIKYFPIDMADFYKENNNPISQEPINSSNDTINTDQNPDDLIDSESLSKGYYKKGITLLYSIKNPPPAYAVIVSKNEASCLHYSQIHGVKPNQLSKKWVLDRLYNTNIDIESEDFSYAAYLSEAKGYGSPEMKLVDDYGVLK